MQQYIVMVNRNLEQEQIKKGKDVLDVNRRYTY